MNVRARACVRVCVCARECASIPRDVRPRRRRRRRKNILSRRRGPHNAVVGRSQRRRRRRRSRVNLPSVVVVLLLPHNNNNNNKNNVRARTRPVHNTRCRRYYYCYYCYCRRVVFWILTTTVEYNYERRVYSAHFSVEKRFVRRSVGLLRARREFRTADISQDSVESVVKAGRLARCSFVLSAVLVAG